MKMNRISLRNDCVEYKYLLHIPLAAGLAERPATSLSTPNIADYLSHCPTRLSNIQMPQ